MAMSRLSVPFTARHVRHTSGSVTNTVNNPTMELYDSPGKENLHSGELRTGSHCQHSWVCTGLGTAM